MIHLGLVGYPVGHSLSPKLHTAALQACKLEGDYSLFPIRPDDMLGLKDLLARVRAKEIHGLNVTIPTMNLFCTDTSEQIFQPQHVIRTNRKQRIVAFQLAGLQ